MGGSRWQDDYSVSAHDWALKRDWFAFKFKYAWRETDTQGLVLDPEGNYVFALEIDGIEVAQFLECSGLKKHDRDL